MATTAIFHPDLGVRQGVLDAADRLRAAGHTVRIVDQYDGRTFDDHESAGRHVDEIGFPALMQRALDAVSDLPDGFCALGFSNGGGMAEFVALHRPLAKVVLASGTLPLQILGADAWPGGTGVQIHYAVDDPFRSDEWMQSVIDSVEASGAPLEVHADYPIAGHLFTDPSFTDYDRDATELFWQRTLAFLADDE